MKSFTVALPLVLLCMFFATPASGQQGFEVSYGNGLHHFFDGQYQKAYDSLSTAITENNRDPRAYYFRGLAAQRLGIGGSGDFQLGAQLEAASGGRLSMVNNALERVQGSARIKLERSRSEALLSAKRGDQYAQPVVTVNSTHPIGGSSTRPTLPSVPEVTPIVEMPATAPGQEIEPQPFDDREMMEAKKREMEAMKATEAAEAVDPSPFGSDTRPASESPTPFGSETKPAAPVDTPPFGSETKPAAPVDASPFGSETKPAAPVDASPFGSETKPAAPVGGVGGGNVPVRPSPFGSETKPVAPVDASPFGSETKPAAPVGGAAGGNVPDDPFGN